MGNFLLIFLALATPVYAPPPAQTGQGATIPAVVEMTIISAEPGWRLVEKQAVSNNPRESVHNPHLEEDGVTLTWEREGEEVVVVAFKFKDVEWARHAFAGSTITPIMRKGYRLSKEGEELRKLVACGEGGGHCVGFFTNRSANGYVGSYDAVFRKDRAVIIVKARKPGVAQRFALHIAQALSAT